MHDTAAFFSVSWRNRIETEMILVDEKWGFPVAILNHGPIMAGWWSRNVSTSRESETHMALKGEIWWKAAKSNTLWWFNKATGNGLDMAIYSWFTYNKWWFSIAVLIYQRVVDQSKIPSTSPMSADVSRYPRHRRKISTKLFPPSSEVACSTGWTGSPG